MRIDENVICWVRLSLVSRLTPRDIRLLLGRIGLPQHIFRATPVAIAAATSLEIANKFQANTPSEAIDATLAWLSLENHALISLADEVYPKTLLAIADPPPVLLAAGQLHLLHQPSIAIVGSRNATPQGVNNARAFAKVLSQSGLTVVSGLALGIDAAAHHGALEGLGSTVGVLGCGIDQRYPRANALLQEEMEARGLVISEFPLGSPPERAHFPRRNRVISGLSRGCLVVEAALGSGSLITASLAADQGKDVFAIPGSIHSPVSRGCHALIKQGAKLVECANDVMEEIRWQERISDKPKISREDNPLTPYMGYDSVDIDTLAERSGLTAAAVSAMLLQMELDGHVGSLPGGLYQLAK